MTESEMLQEAIRRTTNTYKTKYKAAPEGEIFDSMVQASLRNIQAHQRHKAAQAADRATWGGYNMHKEKAAGLNEHMYTRKHLGFVDVWESGTGYNDVNGGFATRKQGE